jgi:predicted amidohydrolase
MNRPLTIASVQFEHRDGDKPHNLAKIESLARQAAARGAEFVVFHECCIPGYTFLQHLDRDALLALAEPVPDGPSLRRVDALARELGAVLMVGLMERDAEGRVYNAYVALDGSGRALLHHRKLHVFINPHQTPGDHFTVGEVRGTKVGVLICYDNNLPENVRATTLLGAELIVMPHVTGATPSPMVGRGPIDPALWENRRADPARLRHEILGPKGRAWVMRWLPARAWENGVYVAFANAVGLDGGSIRPGGAVLVDPDGEIMTETWEPEDALVLATLTPEPLARASGRRYLRARRPDLYTLLTAPPDEPPDTQPGWARAFSPPASPRSP